MPHIRTLLSALGVLLGAIPHAKAATIGDWIYEVSVPHYAATINDSGNIFGQWCDTSEGSCFYLLAMPTRCEDEASYPVLVNSDMGSLTTTLVCRGKLDGRNLYRYVMANFDDIDNLVRKSRRVGIAMPLEGDEFRVSRFSLSGAAASLSLMRSAAESSLSRQPRQNTKDQRL
jgi:hypothetical protein